MTTLFHWTLHQRAKSILRDGFKDTLHRQPPGVHLCDRRGDEHSIGNDTLLLVELPEDEVIEERLDPYQLKCRDYIIPASIINERGKVFVDATIE